jgi:hypothetical protein
MIPEPEKEKLHQIWINQLYKEHKDISWFYRVKLSPVIIRVADMAGAWGKWEAFYRTITISVQLIENHSWDVVIEILKHEMAHQFVSENARDHDETAHGEHFKSACRRLGVAKWARRASGPLPDKIPGIRERVISPDDLRLLERVEKLLSLAQSSNEHEAFLAMQKSRELCAKHNLEKIAHNLSDDSMDSLYLTRQKKKTDPVEAKILSILNDHFSVKVIHTSLFDAKLCQKFQAAEVLGRRESILMADYVYNFLHQQCDLLWLQFKKSKGLHGSNRRSYQLGILAGFDDKLADSRLRAPDINKKIESLGHDLFALQKIDNAQLNEFVATRYPRLSKKSWGAGHLDRSVFGAGQVEGRKLNFNRPISNQIKFGGYLK